jgi:hypothetical protein
MYLFASSGNEILDSRERVEAGAGVPRFTLCWVRSGAIGDKPAGKATMDVDVVIRDTEAVPVKD